MKRMVRAAVAAAVMFGAPAVQAQDALRMQVTGETDAGGAAPTCALQFRLTNGRTDRISVYGADIRAVHAQTGAELRVPIATVPFSGIQPGETKEWRAGAVVGARCESVRLQVTRVTCVRRCGPGTWTNQGLAAVELLPR